MNRLNLIWEIPLVLLVAWLLIAGVWKTVELLPKHDGGVAAITGPDTAHVVLPATDTVHVAPGGSAITHHGHTTPNYPDASALIITELRGENDDLRVARDTARERLKRARSIEDSLRTLLDLQRGLNDIHGMISITTTVKPKTWGLIFRPGIGAAYGYEPSIDRWAWVPVGRVKYLWWHRWTLSAFTTTREWWPAAPGYHLDQLGLRGVEIMAAPGIRFAGGTSIRVALAAP